MFAIGYHNDSCGENGGFPVVKNYLTDVDVRVAACLWDADRMDLERLGIKVREEYLSLKRQI